MVCCWIVSGGWMTDPSGRELGAICVWMVLWAIHLNEIETRLEDDHEWKWHPKIWDLNKEYENPMMITKEGVGQGKTEIKNE